MVERFTPLQIAIHEAGHLVVQLLDPLAPWVEEVWILSEGRGDYLGQVVSPCRWNRSVAELAMNAAGETAPLLELVRANAEADIIVAMAGPIAEARWRYRSWDGATVFGALAARLCLSGEASAHTDLGKVKARLDWLCDAPTTADFARAWDAATVLVRASWPQIERVGRCLAVARTLSADDIVALRAELHATRMQHAA